MMSEQTCEDDGLPSDRISDQSDALLAEAIEAIGFGIVLVAEDGFITFANAMARALLRRGEGLRANGGWIAGTSADVTTRLRASVKHSRKAADGQAGNGATVFLERGAGRPSLFVHVMPLARRSKPVTRSVTAVIFIIDPEVYALPSFNAFAALYGLTRGEARVLREIIGGQGLVAAAAKLRISETTARTHLQHIFDKTGTKRQTELLCLFFRATLPGQIGSD
jgi:DNA-binding CsgD family transcriptional regulator